MASVLDGERTRGKRLMRAVILVGVLVVAALFGYGGIREMLQSSDARSALSGYLDDVRQGDYAGAYQRLCRSVPTGYTEAQHRRFLREQPDFVSFELDNATTATTAARTTITFSVHFLDPAGGTRVVRMLVDMDDGAKVCDGPGARMNQ